MASADFSRRRFLQLAGAASAALGMPRSASSCPADGLYDDGNRRIPRGVVGDVERVIVVGAGMAGLSLANALAHAGVDVVVLEARDRIGGRMQTIDLGGAPIDMGAGFIHTPTGNPMTCLANQLGVGQIPAGIQDIVPLLTAYDAENGEVSSQEIGLALVSTVLFENDITRLRQVLGPGASLEDGIHRFLDDFGYSGLARRYAEFANRLLVDADLSGPASDGALSWYGSIGILYEGEDVLPETGYGRIVQDLAEGLDIRLGHHVTSISRRPNGVLVRTAQGRRSKGAPPAPYERSRTKFYWGSHVVVTVPLGVLKSDMIYFDPALPSFQTDAIQNLGFGNFEKVALRFDEPFWQGQRSHFLYVSETPQEYPFFLDFHAFQGEPILVVHTTGDFARSLNDMHPLAVKARVMGILGETFPGTIPQPTDCAVSSWGRDLYTQGAYSYLSLSSNATEFDLLALPTDGRLFFAGEATTRARYSFADGAMLSGVREAKRLLGARAVQLGRLTPQAAFADALLAPLALMVRWRDRTRAARR